jgi:hypothetical protein
MENPLASGEELQDPRPQESMGIGEDPNAHSGEDTAAESSGTARTTPAGRQKNRRVEVTPDLCKSYG